MSDRKHDNKNESLYSGYKVPTNVNIDMYDGGDETTRRASTAFEPIFEPIMTSFDPPTLSSRSPSKHNALNSKSLDTTHVSHSKSLNNANNNNAFVWKIKQLPAVPPCYTLDRSSAFVYNVSPDVVSSRVSKVLYQLSIEAVYDNDNAKVSCTSSEGVEFRVKLYKGYDGFNHGTIVEVQRRFGVSFVYQKEAQAILDSVAGKDYSIPTTEESVIPPPPSFNDYSTGYKSSLQLVEKMLSYAKYDSDMLALQILVNLTDANKTDSQVAQSVSEEVLRPGSSVGNRVFAIIEDYTYTKDDVCNTRGQCFIILANAIKSVSGQVDTELCEALLSVLINELHEAKSNPRTAELAARCIEWMLRAHLSVNDAYGALKEALVAGEERHIGLMRQAQTCLSMM